MNVVAILAVVLTPLVAALALVVGWLQARGERTHGLALARAQHEQTLNLTTQQHEHERQLRKGDRLFEKRGEVYLILLEMLDVLQTRVERTHPLMTLGAPIPPPGMPDEGSIQRTQARVSVWGSADVSALVVEFLRHVQRFSVSAAQLDAMNADPRLGLDIQDLRKALDAHRAAIRELGTKVRERVQREIETL